MRVVGYLIADNWRRMVLGKPPRLYGLELVVGMYGSGKSAYCVNQLNQIKRKYRGARIYTNMGWTGEDGDLRKLGWRYMVEQLRDQAENKSADPVVFLWDEVGNTFNQKTHATFPVELLQLLTQCRKGSVRILCTVQRSSMAEVDIRRMAAFITEVRGYMGARWISSRSYEGFEQFNDGLPRYAGQSQRDLRVVHHGSAFVFTDALRAQYDSFALIKALAEYGDEDMELAAERSQGNRAVFERHEQRRLSQVRDRDHAADGERHARSNIRTFERRAR
jgi:hypothetical protein